MESLRKAINDDLTWHARPSDDAHNQRVVTYAPTQQDAELCRKILRSNHIEVCCCSEMASFVHTISEGAGIALIAQEHLSEAAITLLKESLDRQPKWSEVPILVLLQAGEVGADTLQRILTLDDVTLINRPLRIAVFISTVRAKLRDRMRQFELRDLLHEKDIAQLSLSREAHRLDMAIQAGGMAAWEWSATDMYWSAAFRRLYGFDDSIRPSAATMFDSVIDEDRDRIVSQWTGAVERDEPFRSEFRIDHPTLGNRWLVAVAEPVKTGAGRTLRYAGLQWDMTESKMAELELRQSHETFQRLITDNPQGLYVVDADLRVRYVSKGARSAFANVNPLIGRRLEEVMNIMWPQDFAQEAVRLFRQTLKTGEPYFAPPLVERRVDTNDVEAYDWSIERFVLPDNRHGVVCYFYNNTQRQQSADLLRESERYFREIADASPAMLWVTDVEHLCTFLSKSWYDTTGQTKEEGMGLGWTLATHPDDQQRAGEEFLAAANARQAFWSEYRLRLADGNYRWVVDVGRPRFDAGGNFAGYTGYVIDVNDRKVFEESLKMAKELAENANRSRGEFLANMSHEIRTPMAAILGHADILKDHLNDPDNLQVVETIRRNGNFLLNIINDILDLSKIDSGKMQMEAELVRPDGLLAEVRSLMDVRASEKQIPLTIEFGGPIPELIETDAVRLRQILLNLVGNAIKFTDAGEVRVICRYEPSGTLSQDELLADGLARSFQASDSSGQLPWETHLCRLTFEIIDTGIGISAENQQTLFQPFVQADNTSTRSFGGTGLGLAICRRLASALGGNVSLESEFGKGSKFTLVIQTKARGPLVEPNLSIDVTAEQPDEDLSLTAHVLVVDDRRDIRYLAQHFIEKAGGTVCTATNGQEALDFISNRKSPHVDLIVMDMQMPVMDGYEATAELRRRGCTLPIIALTANAMNSDREECLAAGCTDYTTKPLDSKLLVRKISNSLAENHS
ncbi:response regulator [Allorhodopirellula heiligendammensis]|uniref:histidine kinase n=1 Tax=Allorhodopirellula heiligendammensis TaxID=2714739 RepID=A0A5C6BH13_9BACT|nr:response regulator [Allorhodopirellula heiligendammensis]TWU10576.1 Aerobic respiration control sensor protein ArcB [Allorhodopirellula heiligendammensis]